MSRSNIHIIYITTLVTTIIGLTSCSLDGNWKTGKLKVVATTGMIGDAVKNITGDSADVFVLMGPGVDPHLYKPTPRDVDKLAEADVIIYNGLHLEGKMGEILQKISKQKKVIALSDGISKNRLIRLTEDPEHEAFDPHLWFDVDLWKNGIIHLGKELAKLDSANGSYYIQNLERYSVQLENLDQWTRSQIATIPEKQRVLVTAHDAFSYFGQAYNIEVMGLQGISTVSEPGLKDITQLTTLLSERNIKAVFVESSVSEKAINAVIFGCKEKDHEVIIGGTLYSDAMGDQGTKEGTYVGMVRHNVGVIVKGLK